MNCSDEVFLYNGADLLRPLYSQDRDKGQGKSSTRPELWSSTESSTASGRTVSEHATKGKDPYIVDLASVEPTGTADRFAVSVSGNIT